MSTTKNNIIEISLKLLIFDTLHNKYQYTILFSVFSVKEIGKFDLYRPTLLYKIPGLWFLVELAEEDRAAGSQDGPHSAHELLHTVLDPDTEFWPRFESGGIKKKKIENNFREKGIFF